MKTMSKDGLHTFADVKKLTKTKLKALCIEHNITPHHGKNALVTILCQHLGISTSGPDSKQFLPRIKQHNLTKDQLKEFSDISLPWVESISGYTKELNRCPEIDDGTVKQYLLDCGALSPALSRKYKITRPYQLKPFIHSMRFNELSESHIFSIVTAKCNPSQSTDEDEVKSLFIIFNKETQAPLGGFCTCTAGQSQSCGHIGAALFVLADIIACGQASLPPDATCTDVPCYWAKPKGAAVKAQKLNDVNIKKKATGAMRRTSSDYGMFLSSKRPCPSKYDILQLRSDLAFAMQNEGKWLPAIHACDASRFENIIYSSPHTSLPDTVMELDSSLAPAAVCEVETSPCPPLAVHPLLTLTSNSDSATISENLMVNLKFTQAECDKIETSTRGQHENLVWYHQRMGAITSSQCGEILSSYQPGSRISKTRLANQCLGDSYKNLKHVPSCGVKSLRYGHVSEPAARQAYETLMKEKHKGFTIKLSGIVVKQDKPYLRASPDGIVECLCHPRRLLEIKCPYSACNDDVLSAIKNGRIDYLSTSLELSQTKRGYYSQIQMAMALTSCESCDFVVWTNKDFKVMEVSFDRSHWIQLEKTLDSFFRDFVLRAIRDGPF